MPTATLPVLQPDMSYGNKIERAPNDWNLERLARDLREADWEIVEPGRMERRAVLHNYEQILFSAKQLVNKKEWREAIENGVEDEFAHEYISAVAKAVSLIMGGGVYAYWDNNTAYLGQQMQYKVEKPGVLDWQP